MKEIISMVCWTIADVFTQWGKKLDRDIKVQKAMDKISKLL